MPPPGWQPTDGGLAWDAMPPGARAKIKALADIAMPDAGDGFAKPRLNLGLLPMGESLAQAHRRDLYLSNAQQRIEKVIAETSKVLTDPERALLRAHFRIARRLIRVRALAENAKRIDLAKRAEDALRAHDMRLYAELEAVGRQSAAADPGAP